MQECYYNRMMSDKIVNLVKEGGIYHWMIDYVKNDETLDFQTGSNKYESWFSVYKGTGRIFKIKDNGKLYADNTYIKLYPQFYKDPTPENLTTLLENVKDDSTLGRYYINSKGQKKEGYYQNLISRRYSFLCDENDEFIIFDKEFKVGYEKDTIKKNLTKKYIDKYNHIIDVIKSKNILPGKIKAHGDECDFVALSKTGDVILIELKDPTNSQEIYQSPLQVGKYDDITQDYMDNYREDFERVILSMIKQKQELGILTPKWDIPTKLSGKILLYVVSGGRKPSTTVLDRFVATRKVVEKDVTLFTSDTKGSLVKVI